MNSHTLTYTGKDFSGKIPRQGVEKVNHGLVIMWASLANNFIQPVAVFACKVNLVKGFKYKVLNLLFLTEKKYRYYYGFFFFY